MELQTLMDTVGSGDEDEDEDEDDDEEGDESAAQRRSISKGPTSTAQRSVFSPLKAHASCIISRGKGEMDAAAATTAVGKATTPL